MSSTYSALKIELIADGEQTGAWGQTTNVNLGTALEEAIVASADVTFNNDNVTLTLVDSNVSQTARCLRLNLVGVADSSHDLIVPAGLQKQYIITNNLASTIYVRGLSGTIVDVKAGSTTTVYSDGTNVITGTNYLPYLFVDTLDFNSLNTAISVANGGTGVTSITGLIQGNGASPFTTAAAGTDYVTPDGIEILQNKTLVNPGVKNYTEFSVDFTTVTTTLELYLDLGTMLTATLTASTACVVTMPTIESGKSFILMLKQAATTGNGTATFTNVKWNSVGAPTMTAAAGKMDIYTFVCDGVNWYGSYSQGYTP